MQDSIKVHPRTLFFGMQNAMSYAAFSALVELKINVCGVVLAESPTRGALEGKAASDPRDFSTWSELPQINRYITSGVYELAIERQIPTFLTGNDISKVSEAVDTIQPDIGCIACFPLRIPGNSIDRLPYGILNLHPSLLPYHRGPYPLFWQFRSGRLDRCGVSIHLIDDDLDTGDLVLQRRILYEDGISGREAETMAGQAGGVQLAKAVIGLYENTLEPYPQSAGGSYQGTPTSSDFLIPKEWSAARAFNFIRATDHWGYPFIVPSGSDHIEVVSALSYNPYGETAEQVTRYGDVVHLKFNPGILMARLR